MTTITPLPTPAPSRDQTQSAFNSAANALFGALPTMVTQINTVVGEVNAAAGAAAASASAASSSADQATTNGAAQVAIAQDWAIKTAGPVSGGEYSAKYHAQAAAASASAAINAPGTSATSTTSLTIGAGSKSLTIQTGKQFAVGQFVVIASTASPSNYMIGQITAHDNGTGALVVNVSAIGSGGTLADWTISLTAVTGGTSEINIALFNLGVI